MAQTRRRAEGAQTRGRRADARKAWSTVRCPRST